MKIAIITQPLIGNYGGILQNYALQKIVSSISQTEVETIDFMRIPRYSLKRCLRSWTKTLFLRLFFKNKRPFLRYSSKGIRKHIINDFIQKKINTTNLTFNYNEKMAKSYDCIIVGSDQVWRPRYNYKIENSFLDFAKNTSIKRIAYAASFGVDEWEYSPTQEKICSALAKKFDAISVREESGVKLCKEHLGVEATWVLDPTLLLKKEEYLQLCQDTPVNASRFIAVYVLSLNDTIKATYENIAKEKNLEIKYFAADAKASLSVSEWLAMFRDASYVVTDSFHGTVFSIIFEKEFQCIYNQDRGATRFESLLDLYNSGKLNEKRQSSLNWLKNALES